MAASEIYAAIVQINDIIICMGKWVSSDDYDKFLNALKMGCHMKFIDLTQTLSLEILFTDTVIGVRRIEKQPTR